MDAADVSLPERSRLEQTYQLGGLHEGHRTCTSHLAHEASGGIPPQRSGYHDSSNMTMENQGIPLTA